MRAGFICCLAQILIENSDSQSFQTNVGSQAWQKITKTNQPAYVWKAYTPSLSFHASLFIVFLLYIVRCSCKRAAIIGSSDANADLFVCDEVLLVLRLWWKWYFYNSAARFFYAKNASAEKMGLAAECNMMWYSGWWRTLLRQLHT